MKYAIFAADGTIETAHNDDTVLELPVGALPLTDEQLEQWPNYRRSEDGLSLQWVEPPVPPVKVPDAVTMRQARLALLGAGKLAAVNAAVAAMPGAAGEAARIEWEFSSEVLRHKQLVLNLAPVLGLNEAQLDNLFIEAAKL